VFTQKGIFRLKNKNINSDRKISVVITYFNRHDTIHKALYNILADNRVDEILIVDDHSENASFSYLQDLVKKINNPKVKVIRNDVNLGVYKNKIYSVNKAKNDWLILLDSDNTITLDYLNTVFSIEKWDDDTIYGPVFGWPLIDNTKIAGKTYTISDIKNLLIHQSKEIKQFLNLGNFLINKNNFYNITIEYIDYNPYASDVIFVNYIWLSKGKKINILNCKYIHRVNPDSTWKIQNVQSAVKFENIKNAILTLETDPKKII
jgi:glycosyltransferase involved in cell wall biosynthesis